MNDEDSKRSNPNPRESYRCSSLSETKMRRYETAASSKPLKKKKIQNKMLEKKKIKRAATTGK